MKDLLLEIGTEEIPAGFMPSAIKELKDNAEKYLNEKRIQFNDIRTMGTPRRLILLVEGLADKQSDIEELVKGPAVKIAFDADGNPSKAGAGFARGQGVDPSQLIKKELDGVEYVYALKQLKGENVESIIPEFFVGMIQGLHFPKPMRWESFDFKFARPIRWLLGLYDNKVIDFAIEGVQSSNKTRGHRFLGKSEIEVSDVKDFFVKLDENFVIADQKKREELITGQMKALEEKHNFVIGEDEDLLEEVVYLVEYPTALVGDFEEHFLQIPPEAVITPMKEHQRYFPVFNKEGNLANHFVTVRNGNSEHLETVKEGNEKVLTARLKDAEFFFEEDKKNPLDSYTEKLKAVVYQEDLGTIYEKVERIIANTVKIAEFLNVDKEVKENAERGAILAKADLVTNMVYEFPELQGIMGEKYARLSGEKEVVAKAIFEHYLPRNAEDFLPSTMEGKIISIADKIDTITGSFAIGVEPTGSQDPYALRRQAQGICKIIIDGKLELPLKELIKIAVSSFEGKIEIKEETIQKLYDFFGLRMKNILTEQGYSYDVIDAVLAKDYSALAKVSKKAEALAKIKTSEEFEALLAGFIRANNIAKKYEASEIHADLIQDQFEKNLYDAYVEVQIKVMNLLKEDKYYEILVEIASLEKEINEFFDNVMVMVEDEKVKNNRLALVKSISLLPEDIGDITKIVV